MRMRRALVETPYGFIHYRYAGVHHDRTVVVSHISQQSSALMIELLEALSDRVQAIVIDYPSCGMSDHVSIQPTIEDYAQCVIAAMDVAGVQRATALGEATGAFVAAALVALAPGAQSEVIPGARFCVTWSHASHIAKRTLAFMGL